MKRLIVIALVAVMLVGCTPQSAFVRAVDNHVSVILPEYTAYVAADEKLDPTSIRIRIESADALTALIDSAKGAE